MVLINQWIWKKMHVYFRTVWPFFSKSSIFKPPTSGRLVKSGSLRPVNEYHPIISITNFHSDHEKKKNVHETHFWIWERNPDCIKVSDRYNIWDLKPTIAVYWNRCVFRSTKVLLCCDAFLRVYGAWVVLSIFFFQKRTSCVLNKFNPRTLFRV